MLLSVSALYPALPWYFLAKWTACAQWRLCSSSLVSSIYLSMFVYTYLSIHLSIHRDRAIHCQSASVRVSLGVSSLGPRPFASTHHCPLHPHIIPLCIHTSLPFASTHHCPLHPHIIALCIHTPLPFAPTHHCPLHPHIIAICIHTSLPCLPQPCCMHSLGADRHPRFPRFSCTHTALPSTSIMTHTHTHTHTQSVSLNQCKPIVALRSNIATLTHARLCANTAL